VIGSTRSNLINTYTANPKLFDQKPCTLTPHPYPKRNAFNPDP